jgi:hypothetical protein
MNDEKIYDLIDGFNKNIKDLCDNFESKINEVNLKLFNDEFQIILNNHNKKLEKKFRDLYECIIIMVIYMKETGKMMKRKEKEQNIIIEMINLKEINM